MDHSNSLAVVEFNIFHKQFFLFTSFRRTRDLVISIATHFLNYLFFCVERRELFTFSDILFRFEFKTRQHENNWWFIFFVQFFVCQPMKTANYNLTHIAGRHKRHYQHVNSNKKKREEFFLSVKETKKIFVCLQQSTSRSVLKMLFRIRSEWVYVVFSLSRATIALSRYFFAFLLCSENLKRRRRRTKYCLMDLCTRKNVWWSGGNWTEIFQALINFFSQIFRSFFIITF